MGAKESLIAALCTPFDDAETMQIINTRQIPELADIGTPSDQEDAVMKIAQYCANANKVLQAFSGFPILKYLLMGCTMTPVFHNMHLAGIEFEQQRFSVVAPSSDGGYIGFFSDWVVRILQGAAESVTIQCGADQVEMSKDGAMFTASFPVPVGSHTAVVTAVFPGGVTSQQTVSFRVQDCEVSPADGSTISEEQEFKLLGMNAEQAQLYLEWKTMMDGKAVLRQQTLQAKRDAYQNLIVSFVFAGENPIGFVKAIWEAQKADAAYQKACGYQFAT